MPSFLVFFSIVMMVVGGYGYLNQPIQEPNWPERIPGFAFSPYGIDQSPVDGDFPTLEQIESDLQLLSTSTYAIRTYTVENVFGEVPALARKYKLNVALGAWFDANLESNQVELEKLAKIAARNPKNIVRIVAGNEALLREDITVEQLIEYLKFLQKSLDIPISTAEPWHVWVKYPELVKHVDYLAVHMLPYWEGVSLERSIDHIIEKYAILQEAYPGKPIVITEVGWPSHGRSIKDAVASKANQAIFLRRFIETARERGYTFYVMEAFDQPWKSKIEGSIGGHWGVYDIERQQKFEMVNPIIAMPEWKFLAAASVLIGLLLALVLMADGQTLRHSGRSFLMTVAFGISCLVIYVIYDFSLQYHDWLSTTVGILLLIGVTGVFLVILAEAHEWAEALWYSRRQRHIEDLIPDKSYLPFVSIHVPAYNEPPEMLKETLNALARLDYPNFEVIVIDNNTPDESTWRPVEAHCAELGERFRFYHKSPLAGYKAGALNFALEQTTDQAEIIAVIDSDYQVDADWLRRLVPAFAKEKIAIVQAPQDYRDDSECGFKAMAYAEYRGFFHLGMVTRNERNAIIQHGTMTMVRRTVLEQVGRWGTDTITEDAELGLRIFENGFEAAYAEESHGRGLIPDTFIDYKKQRYRWAYGAMQIMRSHAKELLNLKKTRLVTGQRYHFLAGWLPWVADGFNLVFTAMAFVWSGLMIYDPIRFNAPPLMISAIPVMFFSFKILKMFSLYLGQVRTSFAAALAATLAGLALSYTIARATLSGLLIGRKKPFFRTPKNASSAAITKAFIDAREEVLVGSALLAMAWALTEFSKVESKETDLWVIVLLVQTAPYVAALIVSLVSALPGIPARLFGAKRRPSREKPAQTGQS